MKKKLQWTTWLVLAALVVGINFKASAVTQPTLTQAWKITEGLPEKMDARQGFAMDGKVYIQNKATGVIEIWTKDGKSAETLTSAAGSWPAIGTDDAKNIIVRIDASWPNNMPEDVAQFRIFPAAGGDPVDLKLDFTGGPGLEAAPTRMDFFGHAKGNLLDENEGGVLYLASQNSSVIYVVTVMGGVQDVDNTYTASVAPLAFNNMATIYAKGESDVIICNRGAGNNYIWGTFEGESLDLSKVLVTPDKQSTNGCAVFTMGGKDYIAYPCGTDPKGAQYFDGFAIAEMSTDAANPKLVEHAAEFTSTSGYQSMWLSVEPVSDTKANVYQYFPGGCIAMFTFEVPGEPTFDNYYVIGAVEGQGWAADKGTALTTTDGKVYTGKIKFADGDKAYVTFALSTKLGASADDWASIADTRKGPAVDGTIINLVNTSADLAANANAYSINAGEYDVTVNVENGLVSLTPTTQVTPVFPENVYLIGAIDGINAWQPNSGLKLDKVSDGFYAGTFSCQADANFAIVEKLAAGTEQADWDMVNALRYGFDANSKVLELDKVAKIFRNSNSGQLAAGKYKIMVNLNTSEIKLEAAPEELVPTLTQVWKITEGLPDKMETRQATVVDGKFYIQNKGAGVVEIWTKDGKSAETLTSAAGSWPAIGTDDAKNIIVRIDASWPNNMPEDVAQFRIFPAAGGDPVDLKLDFTGAPGLEAAPTRMDFFGHAKGNLLDENEGGVLYLASQNSSVIYVVTVMGGVQDVDNTYTASVAPLAFNNMATIYAKGENDVVICNRGAGNNYIWGTFEGESLDLSKVLVTPDKQSTNGCAVFTMGGKDYIAYPCGTDPKGAQYFDGFAIAEMSTDAANPKLVEHAAEFTTTSGYQSMWLSVEPVSDTKANVYQYFPGGCIAMYTFELASSTPAPAPEQLYVIGEVVGAESWKPNSGIKLEKKEDGTYSARATFNGNGSWGIVEQLGATEEDWTTVNALRYGPAKDMDLVKKGVATAISKNTNAFKIFVGTYDVTVDLAAKTVLCEQVVTPSDRAVYAYGLTAAEDGADYVLTYSLNTAAKDVTIKVTDKDGAQVGELIDAPVAVGSNVVRIAKASYPGENLSWEVTATGTAIEAYNLITPKTMDFAAWAPYGIDVDKNPESKNFGYVYVTNSGKGSCAKPDGTVVCERGLFVYNPALQRMTVGGKTVFTGGLEFENVPSVTYADPRLVKVADDGSIFVGCNSISHNSLYKVDPSNFDSWSPVFEGTQNTETGVITDANNNFVAGGTIAMSFTGKGNDQQLYVLGSQNRATSFSPGDMFMSVYNIGYKSTWNAAPSKALLIPDGMTNTQANTVCADGNGGYWVAQHRAGGNDTQPTLMHFDSEDNRNYARFSADTEIPNFCAGGGLAFNKEGTMMAVSNSGAGATTKGAIALYTVAYDDQNVPTLTFVENIMTELGTNINEMAFDYAGNLHIVSNSGEWYMAYSGKKADNTETVKCSVVNQLNGNRACNEPTNLQGLVKAEDKYVAVTWDAPAGETPLYYTLSVANGDDVKVFDGIAEASFNHYPDVDNATFTYVVSAVYAGDIVVPSTSIDVLYSVSSVNDINSDSAASKVYPNPTTGMINIESTTGIYKVEVFNGSSQMIEQVSASGDEKAQLDITGQPSGIYFIKINDKAVVKVIKK